MAVKETEVPVAAEPKTYYCIWPEHVLSLGEPAISTIGEFGERRNYKFAQTIRFENQRFTTSDPAMQALLDVEVKRQPMVFSTKWMPNPVLSRRDDADAPRPNVMRGAAVTQA